MWSEPYGFPPHYYITGNFSINFARTCNYPESITLGFPKKTPASLSLSTIGGFPC